MWFAKLTFLRYRPLRRKTIIKTEEKLPLPEYVLPVVPYRLVSTRM